MCTIGFCDQTSSWSSSLGWTKEFYSQQPSLVGDWSHVLGSAQLGSHVLGSAQLVSHVLESRALEGGTVTTKQV